LRYNVTHSSFFKAFKTKNADIGAIFENPVSTLWELRKNNLQREQNHRLQMQQSYVFQHREAFSSKPRYSWQKRERSLQDRDFFFTNENKSSETMTRFSKTRFFSIFLDFSRF
jgi:hypothetical protein